jgi:lysophospholipase L1-like esterase
VRALGGAAALLGVLTGASVVGAAGGGAVEAPGVEAPAVGCVAGAAAGAVDAAGRRPVRILPLGDSITIGMHGTGADWRANKSLRGGYRARLEERLTAAGARFTTVGSSDAIDPREQLGCRAHEGHGGWCLTGGRGRCWADRHVAGGDAGIASHLEGWLAAHEPDVVLLHIGTNDLGSGRSVAQLAADHAAFVEELFRLRPGIALFVSRLHLAGRPDVNVDLAARLRATVEASAARGRRAVFVDTYAGAVEPLTGDDAGGKHPSLATYEVMGDRWADALLAGVPELVTGAPPSA